MFKKYIYYFILVFDEIYMYVVIKTMSLAVMLSIMYHQGLHQTYKEVS